MKKELASKEAYETLVESLKEEELYLESETVKELIDYIFTPPTAEEVCEALNKIFNNKRVYYSSKLNGFLFELENGNTTSIIYKGENIMISYLLPPHIITLIGRFYEAQQ